MQAPALAWEKVLSSLVSHVSSGPGLPLARPGMGGGGGAAMLTALGQAPSLWSLGPSEAGPGVGLSGVPSGSSAACSPGWGRTRGRLLFTKEGLPVGALT